jgi:hypothetical protein
MVVQYGLVEELGVLGVILNRDDKERLLDVGMNDQRAVQGNKVLTVTWPW